MNYKPSEMVKEALESDEEYTRIAPLIADFTKNAKIAACKEIISLIKKVIKSKSNSPPQKLRGLKLLNLCMMVGNVSFLTFTQKKIMSRLGILAAHKKELAPEFRAETIFGKNSISSEENRDASIEFINVLLDYIKLWAGEFGKAPDKSDSVFFTTYMKLKDSGVRFPVKQAARISVKEERKVIHKKSSVIETIENLLSLYEENSDPSLTQDYTQMIRGHKINIENAIQEAMNNNNSEEVENLLKIMDKITVILEAAGKPQRKSEVKVPQQASPVYKSQHSSERSPGSKFDIFDLEISPKGQFEAVNLPVAAKPTNFATHQPIILNPPGQNMMFPNLGASSAPKEKVSMFPSLAPDNNKISNELKELKLENSQLKEALDYAKSQLLERDKYIEELRKSTSELKEENEELSYALKKAFKKMEKFEAEVKNLESAKSAKESHEALSYGFQQIPRPENNRKVPDFFEITAPPAPVSSSKADLFLFDAPKAPEKQFERQTTFDRELDFILSADLKPKTESKPPTSAFMAFDPALSQDEPPKVVIQKPENDLNFRMGNCMEMGVLLDNDQIQIGFQIKRQSNELLCMVYIGNKATEPILEVNSELSDFDSKAFPMLMQPLTTTEEIAQNAQTGRMIKAQFNDFTPKVPKLMVSVKRKSAQSYQVKLPLTILRFIEARQELPSSIWIEWKKLVFEEETCVVNLATFSNLAEMGMFMCLGGAFMIYSCQELQELSQTQVLGAGQFGETLVMFLVTVVQPTQANFCLRCRNNSLRTAVYPLIKAQISKEFG